MEIGTEREATRRAQLALSSQRGGDTEEEEEEEETAGDAFRLDKGALSETTEESGGEQRRDGK